MADVHLRTGEVVPEELFAVLYSSIRALFASDVVAFFEAYRVAADPAHEPMGATGVRLVDRGMLEPSLVMHDTVRSVLLACWEDGAAQLLDPIAG